MQLTEKQARERIAEWRRDCKWIAPAPPTTTASSLFMHGQLIVASLDEFKTIAEAKRHALSLRRAMEGLNALAVCGGFDLEENSQFWRRELEKLAQPEDYSFPLTSGLLSRFEITSSFKRDATQPHVLAYGFATCLSMDPASPAMDVRRQVLEELHDYLLSEPPLLSLTLGASFGAMGEDEWRQYFLTVQHIPHVLSLLSGSEDVERVAISIGMERLSRQNVNFASEALADVLKEGYIDVRNVYGAAVDYPERLDGQLVSISTGFSGMLESLWNAGTVELMSWEIGCQASIDAAVLFSAVASMQPLKSLELVEKFEGAFTETFYEWFAFALRRRKMQGLDLALSVHSDNQEAGAFSRAMRDEETFACLIPQAVLGMAKVDHFPLGTTAKTADGAVLTQRLLMDLEDQRETSSSGSRVDVLAKCGSRCIVVVPTFGLMWIKSSALHSWEYPTERPLQAILPVLGVLVLSKCQLNEVLNSVPAGGSRYYILELSGAFRDEERTRRDRELVRQVCPSLHSLSISAFDIPRLESLLSEKCPMDLIYVAYARQDGTVVPKPSPFFDAIIQPRNHTSHVTELCVAVELTDECLEALAAALENHRYLRLLCLHPSGSEGDWAVLQRPFEVALGPTERSKVWLYAFLWCVRRSPLALSAMPLSARCGRVCCGSSSAPSHILLMDEAKDGKIVARPKQ